MAGGLLGVVKEKLSQLHDWRSMANTQAMVKTLIHDFLYDEKTGLPEEFEPDEIEALSNVVFLHVHSQYRSATDHRYAASAA